MKKSSDTSPDFYPGRCFPERFRTDMKKEIHHIEKSIFFERFLFFIEQAPHKEPQALYERYEKVLHYPDEDKKSISF